MAGVDVKGWSPLHRFSGLGRRVRIEGGAPGKVGRSQVGHALAELDVVRRRSVLVQVEAFELAVPVDSEVPGATDRPDAVHHDEGDARDDEDAAQTADELRPQLR